MLTRASGLHVTLNWAPPSDRGRHAHRMTEVEATSEPGLLACFVGKDVLTLTLGSESRLEGLHFNPWCVAALSLRRPIPAAPHFKRPDFERDQLLFIL